MLLRAEHRRPCFERHFRILGGPDAVGRSDHALRTRMAGAQEPQGPPNSQVLPKPKARVAHVYTPSQKANALEDPDGHLRDAIASWPQVAVLEGIAIFEGKKRAGTQPEGVDRR